MSLSKPVRDGDMESSSCELSLLYTYRITFSSNDIVWSRVGTGYLFVCTICGSKPIMRRNMQQHESTRGHRNSLRDRVGGRQAMHAPFQPAGSSRSTSQQAALAVLE